MKVPAAYEPQNKVVYENNVIVPMRDGTLLKAILWRPAMNGRYPVLVERVPYELTTRCKPYAEYFASRGYVFIGQSTRGVFGSGDQFSFPSTYDGWGDKKDGYDTIEWLAKQPWSNGNIGMIGGSYSGGTQYYAAPTRPPHLKTLFIRMGLADWYRDFFFHDGAYYLGTLHNWAMGQMAVRLGHETAPPGSQAALERVQKAIEESPTWHSRLPIKSLPPLDGVAEWFFEHMDHPEDGPFWHLHRFALKYDQVDVPILHLSGWYDMFLDAAISSFNGVREHGMSERCRRSQRLVIGPWVHGETSPYESKFGDLDFGPDAVIALNDMRLEWYDHWLKGMRNGAMDTPPVRAFLMGTNRWLDLESWPPPRISFVPWYFGNGTGKSEGSLNNGVLSAVMPSGSAQPDSYNYDPAEPVPSVGIGFQVGPKDYSHLEGRMLTYTSDILQKEFAVAGPVRAVLYASSSCADTDWVVRMCDVWPDGRSICVCDGVLRARYRSSFEKPEYLSAGQSYKFEINMSSTAQVFRVGHRVRIQVTSSDFPRYDRNMNTGGRFGEEVSGRVAVNTILHDAQHPSNVILPVMAG